jgi:hypothetical protein
MNNIDLFARYPEPMKRAFKKFHADNPWVYDEFKKLATQMKNSGRKRYSAEAILQVLRWHMDLQTTGVEFKISNNFRSMYARLLVYNNPEFKGFFVMHGIKE